MLIFGAAGLVISLIRFRKKSINILLVLWMLIPIIIPCLPYTLHYHSSLRLFLVFAVPFSIFSVIGFTSLVRILAKYSKLNEVIFMLFFGVMMVGSNIWGVISTHPYQTTFFNSLAGGLKGAQEKKIAFSWDYWLHSYKEAGRWLNENALKDSKVIVLYRIMGMHRSNPHFNLMRYSISRKDIHIIRVPTIPTLHGRILALHKTYIVFIPFNYLRSSKPYLESEESCQIVYQITRQGGEICTIYYNS